MQKKCIALREPCVCQMKSMPSSDLKEYSVRLTAMQILIQKLQNLASLLIVTELPHSLQSSKRGVGEGIRTGGVQREELFVVSKVAAGHKTYEDKCRGFPVYDGKI